MAETKDKKKNKSTEEFKKTILEHLEKRVKTDKLFAKSFTKEKKNIDDCISYIFNTVKKAGIIGYTDDEIFSMAIHYYDEDDIKPGKMFDMQVIINHTVKLTDKEKEEAREEAKQKLVNETRNQMRSKTKTSHQVTQNQKGQKGEQQSLI
jgi:hypothetical protein